MRENGDRLLLCVGDLRTLAFMKTTLPLILLLASGGLAQADPAEILEARYSTSGQLSVTLLHADTGWDDYADAWEVLDAEGNSLGVRVLAHPHVEEQPFTRSLSVMLGDPAPQTVFLRASTNAGGWGEVQELPLN